MNPVRLAISSGCPCGVGPEVTVRALASLDLAALGARCTVYGDGGSLADAARARGVDLASLAHVTVVPVSALAGAERQPGKPGIAAGRAQLLAIDAALDAVLRGDADAIVTAPVSKRAITESGFPFLGHTEHLAHRAGVARVVMLFAGPRLKTALVTTHHAIADVPARITREAVCDTVVITATAMRDDFAIAAPRVAVAGLNPHAGEGGLLGREELDAIGPAIEAARARLPGCDVAGPVPAEAVFRHARDGRYDAVVAMYHDQATIASKLLDFGDAVNVTLGLPFVRTSVDHGTAYDIAGRGVADAQGIVAAITLGARLARSRRDRKG